MPMIRLSAPFPVLGLALLWLLTSVGHAATLHINEFVSENLPQVNDPAAPVDMDGDYPDWIEIRNTGGVSVNLAGYALSDDLAVPAKWTFASIVIPAGGYVVVFASGKNRAIPNVQPHTNFKLSSSGEILLTAPGGSNVHTLTYSNQRQTVSYGSENNTRAGAMKYFTRPTPGSANSAAHAVTNFVADTRFDVDRGFYSAPFTVKITCSTPGAVIAYTLNGSPPSVTNGYQVPAANALVAPTASVAVARTTLLRARAWKTGLGPSDVDTQSYLFLNEVMSQNGPPASMNLLPAETLPWGTSGNDLANLSAFPGLTFYGVNPAIASDADPANRFVMDDLKRVATVSVVMDWKNLFGTNTTGQTDGGIYPPASGVASEGIDRAASLELLNPNGAPVNFNAEKGFQVDGNVHIFGGTSQNRWKSYKLSMSFQGSQPVNYPVYGPHAASSFRKFILDARMNNTWMHPTDNNQRIRCDYVNDQVIGDLQTAMSGRGGCHNRPVHLFLNGLYWGLYSLHERPDHRFAEAYYGGDSDDWDVFKHSVSPAFSESNPLVNTRPSNPTNAISRSNATVVDNYEALLDLVGVGYVAPNPTPDLTVRANYEAVAAKLDLDDFIDYMILNFLAGNWDWSDKNLYATYYRAGNGKWRFHSWDAEHTFRTGAENFLTGRGNEVPRPGQPKGIHNKLKENPEYRLKFADHIRRHMFNAGALSVAGLSNAFDFRLAEIDQAIRAESARWGHIRASARPSPNANVPYKRSDWLARKNSLLVSENGTGPSLLQNRWNLLMAPAPAVGSFRTENLYPSTAAPDFSHDGGAVPTGFQLTLSHSNATGILYFTTDGSDPRVYGTSAVAPSAQAYALPLVLNAPTQVRARVLSGGQWSALTEAMFYTPQDLTALVISELMYHPLPEGALDGDEFEFLELRNVGTNTLNLSGLAFFTGITYFFTNGTLLAPGQNFLLVRNAAAFASRYPGVTINGVYSGRLDNAGETLRLTHTTLGTTILSMTYNDRSPWPVAADGFAFSIVLLNPETRPDMDDGRNWRASGQPGGSPGTADAPAAIPAVLINEVLSASVFPDVDAIELFNPTGADVDIGGWFLTDEPSVPRKYRIPDGTMIPAGTFRVFTETNFNPTPGTNNSFSLSSQGEAVYLLSGNAATNLTGYSHGFSFNAATPGVTFGRYLTSVGEEHFPAQSASTLGTHNAGPRVGPVVINEIQYNPMEGGDEFVELRNISSNAVPLFDWSHASNTWVVGGLAYTFPTNVTLEPDGLLLVVPTLPEVFRAKYSVPAPVQIIGPYQGLLQNSGERLSLRRPSLPDTNGAFAYITVDEVRYNDKNPWPPAADGSGPSLQRRAAAAYADDPANWTAALPTPGEPYAGGTPPTIVVSPTNATVVAYRDALLSVVAEGPAPLLYQWRFQGDDLAGAINASLLLTNVQPSQAGSYRVVVFNAAGSVLSANATLTVLIPPTITKQPHDTNVMRGSNVTLAVTATGNGSLRYQWSKNNAPVFGATNQSLNLTNAQLTDEGYYAAEVGDSVASLVSRTAFVRVVYRPVIVEQLSPRTNVVLQGGDATFRIVASGSLPLSFRWRRGSTTLTNMILDTNLSVFTFTNVQPGAANNVTVAITNLASGATLLSSNAYFYLLVPGDDTDGDGMTNRDEVLAGSDPLSATSRFEIGSIQTLDGQLCAIEFLAVANRTYVLDYAPVPAPSQWSPAATVESAPTNRWVRWTNAPPPGAAFYRLRIP